MKYAKIFVINPPSPPGYVSNKDSMGGFGQLFPVGATLFPPLDLIYLGSYLSDKGLPAEFLESLSMELDRPQLVRRVAETSAERVLAVVRTSAPTLDWDLEV